MRRASQAAHVCAHALPAPARERCAGAAQCGGARAAVAAAEPYLRAMGKRVHYCGGPGSGQAAKVLPRPVAGGGVPSRVLPRAAAGGRAPAHLRDVRSVRRASHGGSWAGQHGKAVERFAAGA